MRENLIAHVLGVIKSTVLQSGHLLPTISYRERVAGIRYNKLKLEATITRKQSHFGPSTEIDMSDKMSDRKAW